MPVMTSAGPAPKALLGRLCAAGVLAYCSYAICRTPLLPLFARELGADARLVGVVMGASTVTGVFVKLPAGAWSDVLGRRTLLVTAALVFAALPFAYLAVSALSLLIAIRAVHGSATAILGPVASASLSDVAPPDRRSTWLATYATCQGAGQAAGPIVAGYMIASGGFHGAFVVAGIIGLAALVVVVGWPAAPSARPATRSWREVVRGAREVTRQRGILATSAAQAAHFVTNGTLNAFLPLYGREVLGLTIGELGWLFGLQTLTTLMTRPMIGVVSDRFGRRALISVGLALCSAAVMSIAASDSFQRLVISVCVYAVGVALTTAVASAYITDLTARHRYGAAHGVFGTIYDVGDAAGPLLGGLFVSAWGYATTFRAAGGLAAAAAVMFYVSTRGQRRAL
jgi:MFS transporter, DHA1 family, multidrug resistance protein